jgi:hypothetical protein
VSRNVIPTPEENIQDTSEFIQNSASIHHLAAFSHFDFRQFPRVARASPHLEFDFHFLNLPKVTPDLGGDFPHGVHKD